MGFIPPPLPPPREAGGSRHRALPLRAPRVLDEIRVVSGNPKAKPQIGAEKHRVKGV
jgi:hypothetical protein